MKNILFLFLLTFIAVSCSTSEKKYNSNEMEFEVLDSLVQSDPVQIDSLAKFRVPISFNLADSNVFSLLSRKISATNTYSLAVKSIFLSNESIVVCSTVPRDSLTLDLLKANTNDIFNRNNVWQKVQLNIFNYNKISFHQVMLQNNQMVCFKLIGDKGYDDYFQIDYLISLKDYSTLIKSIESSIGSIY